MSFLKINVVRCGAKCLLLFAAVMGWNVRHCHIKAPLELPFLNPEKSPKLKHNVILSIAWFSWPGRLFYEKFINQQYLQTAFRGKYLPLALKKDFAHARYILVGVSIIFYVTTVPINALTKIDIKK